PARRHLGLERAVGEPGDRRVAVEAGCHPHDRTGRMHRDDREKRPRRYPPDISIPTTAPTCFRHPDRPTGRACTRCGRPACPECLVQASVGSQCVDCVRAARPSAPERLRRWNAAEIALATKLVIAANVIVFLFELTGGNL